MELVGYFNQNYKTDNISIYSYMLVEVYSNNPFHEIIDFCTIITDIYLLIQDYSTFVSNY